MSAGCGPSCVYNADIGEGKYRYFGDMGDMKVNGTKYTWTVVGGWGRV